MIARRAGFLSAIVCALLVSGAVAAASRPAPHAAAPAIPAGAFPRELRVSDDGKTLIVSNFLSDTIEFVDLGWLGRRGWTRTKPRRRAALRPAIDAPRPRS